MENLYIITVQMDFIFRGEQFGQTRPEPAKLENARVGFGFYFPRINYSDLK